MGYRRIFSRGGHTCSPLQSPPLSLPFISLPYPFTSLRGPLSRSIWSLGDRYELPQRVLPPNEMANLKNGEL